LGRAGMAHETEAAEIREATAKKIEELKRATDAEIAKENALYHGTGRTSPHVAQLEQQREQTIATMEKQRDTTLAQKQAAFDMARETAAERRLQFTRETQRIEFAAR